MPIVFPTNPTLNQVFTVGSITYQWNGTSWAAQDMAGAPTAASSLTVTDGSNTITQVSQINFSNASVTLGGGGGVSANVTPVYFINGPVQVSPTLTGNGSSNTISFNSIANTFNSLELHLNGLVSNASTAQILSLQINGDGGNDYQYHGRYGLSNSSSDTFFNADPDNKIPLIPSSNVGPSGRIVFSNVQNVGSGRTGIRIQWWLDYIDFNTKLNSSIQGGGFWSSASPLTSITISFPLWNGSVSLWGWLGE